jgi:ribosome recycling factor
MDKKLREELKLRMDGAIKTLENELKGLRTGRASVNLLDPVVVEAYGDRMHIPQVATISIADSRTILVQVWDKSLTKAVEKAINDANLGVTPISDGQLIRMSLPILSEERRKELVKLGHKYGENIKISLRNIRRDGNEELKKMEKDNIITQDQHRSLSEEIQELISAYSKKVDLCVKQKEQEILSMN